MNNKIFFLITCISLCFYINGFAQLSSKHYLPPLTANQSEANSNNEDSFNIGEYYIYLSTPFGTASNPLQISITDGAGNNIATPAGATTIYRGQPSPAIFIDNKQTATTKMYIDATQYNQVLSDRGLIIESHNGQPFFVSFRTVLFNHAGYMISKGAEVTGNSFRIGAAPARPRSSGSQSDTKKNFFVSVMATQNNTLVQINDYDPGIRLMPAHNVPPSTISFTLNAGQTYLIAGDINRGTNYDGIIGAHVASNKPIAVTSGNHLGSIAPAELARADILVDQLVSEEHTGSEYIIQRAAGDNDREIALILPTENNTAIYINGNSTAIATVNAGNYFIVNGSNYNAVTKSMFIQTKNATTGADSNTFVYQFIAAVNNAPNDIWNTSGMNFIPPLDCFNQNEVHMIPAVNQIGTVNFNTTELHIVARTGSTVSINGAAITVPAQLVQGNIDWVTYRVPNITGNAAITSTDAINVALIGGGNSTVGAFAGFGAYYSGFKPNPQTATAQVCSVSGTIDLFTKLPSSIDINATNIKWEFIPNNGSSPISLTPSPADSSPDGVWNANAFDPLHDRTDGVYQYTAEEVCKLRDIKLTVSLILNPDLASYPDADINNAVIRCDSFRLLSPITLTGTNLNNPQYYTDSYTNGGGTLVNWSQDYNTQGTYRVYLRDVNTSNNQDCITEQFIDIIIEPSPSLVSGLDKEICHLQITEITLSTDALGPTASSYDIIAINMNGLTPVAGNPMVQNNVANNEIFNDAYSNTTGTPVDVVYTIKPNSTILNCNEPSRNIVVTVFPQVNTSVIGH